MIFAKEINSILRQKNPFIFIDRILELEYGKYCLALKNVTMTEPCFQGHFPDEPILPGVLIVESMAQAGGFIFAKPNLKQDGVIAAVNVKFLKEVIPGDSMFIHSTFVSSMGHLAKVSCMVLVNEVTVAKGEISYSFKS